ncbi:MAG: pyridoxal 5'-phosphate synthase glutaminase subunit PdxT [Candidatus Altiarchaeota archaeon]
MDVGVLDVQGDVTEHVAALMKASDSLGLKIHVHRVKTPQDIKAMSALVLPGGESTTVGRLMERYGMDSALRDVASEVPILGTCAGMVMFSSEGGNMKEGQKLLGLFDARVERNAYGRQRESFEAELDIPVLGKKSFPGIFIRAPALERVWGRCRVLCRHDGKIVLVQQDNILACAFHPELTEDMRLHEYFLEMI